MQDDLKERLRAQRPEGEPISVARLMDEAADRIAALEAKLAEKDAQLAEALAENARLRETVDAVWKEATTMRNASKLVGPYPTEPSKHRVWVRSMYHAGKKLHELMKPIRALKGSQQ